MRRADRPPVALLFSICLAACATDAPGRDWPVTGSEPGNSRFSRLDQINGDNVSRLRVAWTYRTGDLPPDGRGEIQATPIVVDGVLYTTTPALALVALRADSGTLLWRFDPFTNRDRERHVNRGVTHWADGTDRRVLYTAGRRLYALNARTGKPVRSFGDAGSVDLAAGLTRDIGDAYLVATSPGVVFEDIVIQGTRVGEGDGSAPGDIRAYDVRTGGIRWVFHTIPRPGEPGHETWPSDAWRTAGGANAWAGMAVDVGRGIVYVPTGSATPDFYGGDRAGANLFANSLIALDARTGRRLWHFQTVHHDLWDRDLPAAPNLLTVTRDGARVDAVAQIAKTGFVFLFDRVSGAPLFPIEERPVPLSALRGERAWPTQPMPAKPAPFARQALSEDSLTDLSPTARASAIERYRSLKVSSLFTPPSREGTIILPGFDGGGEWGGAAVDPDHGVLFVNGSDIPWIAAMRESALIPVRSGPPRSGPAVYASHCAGCHGVTRRGLDRGPSLDGVDSRLSADQLSQVIERGRGFMPSFAALAGAEKDAVIAFLRGRPTPAPSTSRQVESRSSERSASAPYEFVGYERWKDPDGYPAIKPPWGTLSAIDLNTGEYRWRIPLGEHAALTARGVPPTGSEQYGGPIVTAGGLVFIAATQDSKFRAFDSRNGRLLWETTLPAPGYATPATYAVGDRQYVVIAAGGGKIGSPSSDTYVAYALP
ncbi:MAG TPA: PQQ-binding-like beta-propeller repeat protein [Gemmatimonadaceae bacterium]|nr:PQQ-binding-like beta-propeller repeat protein [Gemmatimonadaceae bacterium]